MNLVVVEYFYNSVCPYCPAAKSLITKVVEGIKDIEFVEVNTYTEEGIKRGIFLNLMAVPSIAINGIIKMTGWPFEADDLINFIDEAGNI